MAKPAVHTLRDTAGSGWINRIGTKVHSTHRKQGTATTAGRRLAKARKTDHVIHGRDGRIREKNSYGRDPNALKDKR
jgi:uncharacterized protein DUF2188